MTVDVCLRTFIHVLRVNSGVLRIAEGEIENAAELTANV